MVDNIQIGSKNFSLGKETYIMGILNVTPDSFSDGGKFNSIDMSVKHAKEMIEEGATIIDIGGESTRPNHVPVEEKEEIERVVPAIRALREAKIDISISIDTYKARVAENSIEAGANLINDVWGFKKDSEMAKVASFYKVPCCLMHNREEIDYKNFLKDVIEDLKESIYIAKSAGVLEENIILDPGIGFAKTLEQNLILMNNLELIRELGYPVLLGTSRKSMIGNTLNLPVNERVEGTISTTAIGIMKGCDFIRVHDVRENIRAAKMTDAIVRR